jgi:hypothetical protein
MGNTPLEPILIQLALSDRNYAAELHDRLLLAGGCEVRVVNLPDCELRSVLVIDPDHMECLRGPIRNPDRVVLICRNEPEYQAKAWDAGVNSVVSDKDPMSTVVLAVMAAGLRIAKVDAKGAPASPTAPLGFRSASVGNRPPEA